MIQSDYEIFSDFWKNARTVSGSSGDVGSTAFAFACLQEYELQDVQRALVMLAKDMTRTYPISVRDVEKILKGNVEQEAENAYLRVKKAIIHIGRTSSVNFHDPVIHRVISDLGGWYYVCQNLGNGLPEERFYQKFKEGYIRWFDYRNQKQMINAEDYLTGGSDDIVNVGFDGYCQQRTIEQLPSNCNKDITTDDALSIMQKTFGVKFDSIFNSK